MLLGVILIYGGIPPSYSEIRAAERALPQHHWDWDKWKGAKSSERVAPHLVRGGTLPGSVNGVGAGQSAESLTAYDERYLRFPDHLWGHGLNNVLQEAILTSHLTLLSNRTPVFEDYTWSHLPVQYTLYDFALRPTRIPLGAFVGGVLAGQDGVHDEIENEKRERRAVSAAYFEYVCPPSETVEVVYRWPEVTDASGHTLSEDIQEKTRYTEEDTTPPIIRAPSEAQRTPSLLAREDDTTSISPDSTPISISPAQSTPSDVPPFPSWQANGNEIIEWFEKRLDAADVKDKRCVVVREERRVFDSEFFGTEKILALLPELLSSPILRQFEWSALVRGAVERNVQRFFGAKAKAISPSALPNSDGDVDKSANASPAAAAERSIITARASAPGANQTLPGVLALHLRRGDYKRHCTRLKEWGTRYLGAMRLLEDKFDEEHGRPRSSEARPAGVKESEEEREERRTAYYLEHCLPSVEQVVLRLREVREEYEDTLRVARSLEGEANAPESKDARTPRVEYALRDVYVLTNGWPSFVTELREALVADGWGRVVGTPDWESAPAPVRFAVNSDRSSDASAKEEDEEDLNSEERGVSAAIDMGIAERAEVFVGNGFSSLSSNVIMLRLAKGLAIHSNRIL
ncbi:hypothetical protein HYPSUDRAFT_63904 [Hypholoma sublateritium FD-334 SS-4]|uniref:Uncharacterized protein n=1 Tax=Hypholoma sublateritium (strain FD-334 SS-4) TaxID=945553 RepID=A0A0D2LGG6_HYPSF|nr:hypothetical protein HYPSUDRAFT_63904 [Hypholoma sublateritium FD-334 SS-4]